MTKKREEKLKLSKKLFTISKLVRGDVVCDVGCDHGYLSIYLAVVKKKFVYACDVRVNPLKRAKANAKKYRALDRIKFILCDGLNWDFKDVDTIVIAGMGGRLIQRIIFEQEHIKNKNLRIILQPQNFLHELRYNLYLKGFKIEKELAIIDKNKFYNILVVSFSGIVKKITLKENVLGQNLNRTSNDFLLYLDYNRLKLTKRLKGLKAAKKENKKEIEKCTKMLEILQGNDLI